MYYSAFNIPQTDDLGTESRSEYFQVNSLGYYEFENMGPERYRKHGRRDYLLIYNHEGDAVARSRGIDHKIGNGAVVIYRPGEEQYYKLSEDHPVKSFWVHFTGYGVETILERLKFGEDNIFRMEQNDEIPVLVRMARNEILERRIGFELYISSLVVQILSLISRTHLNAGFSSKRLESANKLDLSINYLHSNYQEKITLAQLSGLAGLCPSRYIKVFRERTGYTPKDYHIKIRLQKAKELMGDTNLTIRQIGLIVGFEDQLYFSRVFKKYEGICPRAARENGAVQLHE